MRRAVADAMQSGAFGLSTGFVYAPACFATADEFIDLATVVREHGGIITSHIRSEGDGLVEAIDGILGIARAAAAPLHNSHPKTSAPPHRGTPHGSKPSSGRCLPLPWPFHRALGRT